MKEIIRTLKPYIPEEPATEVKKRLGVERLVRLSANENPYGTSPLVREAIPVSYTHLRAHETCADLVCRLLLEKKKNLLYH